MYPIKGVKHIGDVRCSDVYLLNMNKHSLKYIPSLDLMHNGDRVAFAMRNMQEVNEHLKNQPDVPHRHNYYTILWAMCTTGTHMIDYKEFPIDPGVVFFVSPGQVHKVVTEKDPVGFVFLFTDEFLQQNYIPREFITNLGLFSDIAATPPIVLDDKGRENLLHLSEHIEELFRGNDPYKDEAIGSYLKLFLIECNKYAPKGLEDNPQSIQSSKLLLQTFKEVVENRYNSRLKVADAAEELNVTPDYLNTIIKDNLGKTAKEYIQDRIVLEAKRLGVHTNLSSKEIAFELGFEDPSHFSRFFKKMEQNSFTAFRQQLAQEITGS